MLVSDVMTREVFAVAPDTSLETAARLLAAKHITGVPVVNGNGRPLGVISLSDLVDPDRVRSQREGYPMFYQIAQGTAVEVGDDVMVGEGTVADVMSPFVLSIETSATLVEASNRMIAEEVHRLLVMEGSELVGIISAIDLLRGFVRMQS